MDTAYETRLYSGNYDKIKHYLDGNGLEEVGLEANRQDYHKFIWVLSQDLYDVRNLNLKKEFSLTSIIQNVEDGIIRLEDLKQIPSWKASEYVWAKHLFKLLYGKPDIFSDRVLDTIHKTCCLLFHGHIKYSHNRCKLDTGLNLSTINKLFKDHVDQSNLIVKYKNNLISLTRERPEFYNTGKYESLVNKLKEDHKNNPILLQKMLDRIKPEHYQSKYDEVEENPFEFPYNVRTSNALTTTIHDYNFEDGIFEGEGVDQKFIHETNYQKKCLIIDQIKPSRIKKEYKEFYEEFYSPETFKDNFQVDFPRPQYYPKETWLGLQKFYNPKYKNLLISLEDEGGMNLAYAYIVGISLSHSMQPNTTGTATSGNYRIQKFTRQYWHFSSGLNQDNWSMISKLTKELRNHRANDQTQNCYLGDIEFIERTNKKKRFHKLIRKMIKET